MIGLANLITDDLVEITCQEVLLFLTDGHAQQNNGDSSNRKDRIKERYNIKKQNHS